jgi:multiple sugar transport system substrate-binding protein
MRKLRYGAIGVAGLVAASLAGVGPAVGQSPATGPVTISYLTHWGPDQVAVLDAIGKAYTAENPNVTVEIRAVPFGDLLTTLTTQATSPGGPTITGIYNLWLPDLVKAGVVAPVPEPQLTDITTNWPASAVAGASVDDVLYGYPNEINTYALNYNKRLFAEAGIDAPPATWDELIADAQALTKKDGDVITQQGLGLINSWAAGVVHPWYSMVASDGGDIVDGTTPTLADGAAAETMALYERLVGELGVTDPSLGTADANTAGPFMDNFANGNTAMIIMANWWKGSLEAAMGDAFSDIATAPIPVGPNGEGSHPVSYEWLTVVNANQTPEQQAAAWDFLEFLHGDDSAEVGSGMGGILVAMGIIPSRTSDTTAFADDLSAPFLQAYIQALPDAVPFPMISGGQELSEMIQKKLEGIMFGELTAADAAAQAQTEAEAILSAANPAE